MTEKNEDIIIVNHCKHRVKNTELCLKHRMILVIL